MTNSSPFASITRQGLTYDDVLLVPSYSQVLPRDVETKVDLTPSITLNTPIFSAAMDTVSEYRLAIALAREGGIAMLHKNMSIEDQAEHVRLVKRSESGMIVDPVTLPPDATVKDARALMKKHKIGGIPIVESGNRLIGIVTNRDLRFEHYVDKRLDTIMTKKDLVTAKEKTSLEEAEEILQEYKVEKLPIVNKDNILVGLITFKDIEKKMNFPNACKDSMGRLRVGAAVGVTPDTMDRVDALVESGVDIVTVDTAHGHSKGVLETVKKIKSVHKDLNIVGGNIATRDAAEALAEAGADVVKVGVGPGSICTTRVVTGVGVPQLSAIMEIAEYTKENNIGLIADGGIKQTGDIPKAIAGGADAVMMGSMFAGVDESPGETIIYESRKYKSYRGMGSISAMAKGSKDRYFQDVEDDLKLVPEGIEGRVPYKGYLSEVVHQ
ncbi:MAG: IMP dehydrogenase, partial [Bacteroidetes bacterium]|nr:IMP dehydrogenase [Bacteroidota bacterium]